ncbi:hypothetical protein [Desulfonema magnum]|uniref:Uncharacterized protein n=1 Tax=Desulfonema magnum TaxID=45655 RepID=A0A975BP39_9BACT|nr:hypothetical protein [Desulfonema magnum]QTA88832.1 Uncharacterized protein dnm_048790 [Desulfonema magnum]
MKKKVRYLFEPVTAPQMRYIWGLAKGRTEQLYEMCVRLTGFPSVSFLSMQEASYVIETLKGPTRWLKPPPPKTAEQIGGDTTAMPSYGQMVGIRKLALETGWDKEHLKSHIERQYKTAFRSLDREQARGVYAGLVNIRTYPDKNELESGLRRALR